MPALSIMKCMIWATPPSGFTRAYLHHAAIRPSPVPTQHTPASCHYTLLIGEEAPNTCCLTSLTPRR